MAATSQQRNKVIIGSKGSTTGSSDKLAALSSSNSINKLGGGGGGGGGNLFNTIYLGNKRPRALRAKRGDGEAREDFVVTGIGTVQPNKGNNWQRGSLTEEEKIYAKNLRAIIERERVKYFLKTNPDYLKNYILENAEEEKIQEWISNMQPEENVQHDQEDVDTVKEESKLDTELEEKKISRYESLNEGLHNIGENHELNMLMYNLMKDVAAVVGATASKLFVVDGIGEVAYQFSPDDPSNVKLSRQAIVDVECPIAIAVRSKDTTRMSTMSENSVKNFSKFQEIAEANYDFTIWQPILTTNGEVLGVMEIDKSEGIGFTYEEAFLVKCFTTWGQLTLDFARRNFCLKIDTDIFHMMQAIVKSMSQDVMNVKKVTSLLLTQTKQLLQADRASLFVYSTKSEDEIDLYPLIFDVGHESRERDMKRFKSALRFPADKGIVGYCGKIGKSIAINDVNEDNRFYRNVDKVTGYKSRNVVCTPIRNNGNIIGVLQMINKINEGTFTCIDKHVLEGVSVICGLALHYSKIYDKIRKLNLRYQITLDVASYHRCASIEEARAILGKPLSADMNIVDYTLDTKSLPDHDVPRYAIAMMKDVFNMTKVMKGGPIKFNEETLLRFTLTVRKNYRHVPYHNWAHGFQVAHSFYTLIKTCEGALAPLERLALFVACLCHDLDHRAKTNAYMANFKTPLAAVYSTSTMEYHHFYTAMSILKADGHNIFEDLSSELYERVIRDMKHAILYTDLALFFSNRAILQKIINENKFSWENPEHMMRLKGIIMTACDVSAVTKPWNINRQTVRHIFQEFYDQGDEEKTQLRNPLPMMDREKAHDLPANQVGFIMGICLPCYEVLARILPSTYPMLDGTRSNLQNWSALVAKQKAEKDELEMLQKANEEGEIYEPKYRKERHKVSMSSSTTYTMKHSSSKTSFNGDDSSKKC